MIYEQMKTWMIEIVRNVVSTRNEQEEPKRINWNVYPEPSQDVRTTMLQRCFTAWWEETTQRR